MTHPSNVHVIHADCLDAMRAMPDAILDSVVTDPPYGLSFMGRGWDHGVPGPEFWAEALRVAKPGAYLVAFGGTRTYHRLACAIEDAGWEVRDCLSWLYGSGFPKSLDVGKALDKSGGVSPRDQARILTAKREAAGLTRDALAALVGCTPSSVRDWEEGRVRAVGGHPEHMVPSEVYRARLCEILGYTEDERAIVGIGPGGAIWGRASGIERTGGHTDLARQWQGWGTALKPAWEPAIVARKPLIGTVAENVTAHGTGGINVDACRIATDDVLSIGAGRVGYGSGLDGHNPGAQHPAGRWPANVLLDEEAAAALDAQTGDLGKSSGGKTGRLGYGSGCTGSNPGQNAGGLGDSGGASRFFYCAKASKSERGAGNTHPTVKPIALMRWIVRLVTPPGGLVLDPFAGSGTTGEACEAEGMRAILCEREAEYVEIIRARLARARA